MGFPAECLEAPPTYEKSRVPFRPLASRRADQAPELARAVRRALDAFPGARLVGIVEPAPGSTAVTRPGGVNPSR